MTDPLQPTNTCLQTLQNFSLGSIQVEVSHNNQTKQLPLLAVKGQGPNLLGRDWMNVLTFDLSLLSKLSKNSATLRLPILETFCSSVILSGDLFAIIVF